jgi:hypothetical protein
MTSFWAKKCVIITTLGKKICDFHNFGQKMFLPVSGGKIGRF